ncbi:MAG: hypothetical protein KGL39_56030 [Patescibacteria group bacterium]|nr:hypothetical protein [Patescibacteria group bacterium]
MARARSIKPSFYRDAALVELPIETRLLFPGLWMLADRAGRLEDKPKQIKMEIYPADDFDVDDLLDQLQGAGLIVRYAADGIRYIQVTNFDKHQNPHRDEKASTIPAPFEYGANTVQAPCEDDSNPACTLTPYSLTPCTSNQSTSLPLATPSAPKKTRALSSDETALQAVCRETWASYSEAYMTRYGADPVRNAKVSAQVKQFCQRIPATEAPIVAAFFVGHNAPFYVQKGHPVGSLLADAEKLRTEWATNRPIEPANARAGPGGYAQQRDAERREVGDILTGRKKANERGNAGGNDIPGEAVRVA